MTAPSIQTDYVSGMNIAAAVRAAALNASQVTLSVVGTHTGTGVFGPDLTAITAVYRANPTLAYSASFASGTFSWATLLQPAPVPDPCLNRLMGTWCERGRIVSVNVWTPGYVCDALCSCCGVEGQREDGWAQLIGVSFISGMADCGLVSDAHRTPTS
jgi:hypothetical protein